MFHYKLTVSMGWGGGELDWVSHPPFWRSKTKKSLKVLLIYCGTNKGKLQGLKACSPRKVWNWKVLKCYCMHNVLQVIPKAKINLKKVKMSRILKDKEYLKNISFIASATKNAHCTLTPRPITSYMYKHPWWSCDNDGQSNTGKSCSKNSVFSLNYAIQLT